MTTESTQPRPRHHRWRFARVGGFHQVRFDSADDLKALEHLDEKLWAALCCPTHGLEIDSATLELIDTDKDGFIRVPEVRTAVAWTCSVLKDCRTLLSDDAALPLSIIDDRSEEGARLLASARHILAALGKGDATVIGIEDVADPSRIFAGTAFNGDGVITPEACQDASVRAVLCEIMTCMGSETDRSGAAGISQAKADEFFAQAQAYSDWWDAAQARAATVLPLGEGTVEAALAIQAVRAKVEDYFARCRLAAFDARSLPALNGPLALYDHLADKPLGEEMPRLAALPLASAAPQRPLPLGEGVNPAWAAAIERLRKKAVEPLLGARQTLTEQDWAAVTARLADYDAWLQTRPGSHMEPLGLERVRRILLSGARQAINALLAADRAVEPQARSIADVGRLVRYHRDLHRLLRNFVSFRDFYKQRTKATFQAGTLYLDSRSCELCVRVTDPARHALMAGLSMAYLAYCDCTRPSTGETMMIAAAFTAGDNDYLMVGRNGIFYDRQGRDWNATITRIVDNPISIRQAFFSPYKKSARAIAGFVAKRAAAAQAAASQKLATVIPGAPAAPAPGPSRIDVGTVAALGVALGSIGTVLGAMLAKFIDLGFWIPLAVVGLMLAVSIPSMVIAWFKLRKRNLGPILDANGWAVNARVKISVAFGASLTALAALPPGSSRTLRDPYSRRSPWPLIIVLAALAIALFALNRHGKFHQWTGGRIGTPPAASQPATQPAPGRNSGS